MKLNSVSNKLLGLFLGLALLFLSIGEPLAQSQAFQVKERQRLSAEVSNMYADAQVALSSDEYGKASQLFRMMLNSKSSLPTNFGYLYALTLYELGQYRNSRGFLDKYFEIVGLGGDYQEQAQKLSNLLAAKMGSIKTCKFCDHAGYRFTACQTCQASGSLIADCYRCRGVGRLRCPNCAGEGVVITRNEFGIKEYNTCNVCKGKHIISCPVCAGNKKIAQECPVCLGLKKTASSIVCDHQAHTAETHVH